MNSRHGLVSCAAVVALALVLSGCGGGGMSTEPSNGTSRDGTNDTSNDGNGTRLMLPAGHGLAATGNEPLTIPRGGSTTSGNVVISCPDQAAGDCVVTVNADGTATYAGGMPEVNLSLPAKWQRYTAGNPTLDKTGEELFDEWLSVDRRTTHELVTHGISTSGPVDGSEPVFGIEVDAQRCEGQTGCLGEALSYISPEFAPIMEHNGIPIVKLEGRITYVDEDDGKTTLVDQLSYGGWLDSMFFFAGIARECKVGAAGCTGASPRYTEVDVAPSVYGAYSGTTPTGLGSATWTGVMYGMEDPESTAFGLLRNPDVYLGDARIVIEDLSAPDVDVFFTNIHNVTSSDESIIYGAGGLPFARAPRDEQHPDMSWEDLSVESGLFGEADSASEYIVGMFAGTRHQEVGGEFRRGGIAGVFGATRQ